MKDAKILIADDSELVRDFLSTILEDNGFKVETAENGVDAILKVFDINPDLIILDVEMPVMKGYQASRFLKSLPQTSHIPVVIHTTKSDEMDIMWGYSSGADDFVTKNFDESERLLSVVQERLKKSGEKKSSHVAQKQLYSYEDVLTEVNSFLDRELLNASVISELAGIANKISSAAEVIEKVFALMNKIINFEIGGYYIDRKNEGLLITYENIVNNDFQKLFINTAKPHLKNFLEETSLKKIRINRIKKGTPVENISINKIQTLWAKPVHSLSRRSGVIIFGSSKSRAFTAEQVSTLESVYMHAAMLIHNAVMFNDIKELEEKTRKIFELYVPKEVIKNFLGSSTQSLLSGEKRKIAVLFSDIRSFTSISESLSPERVVSFLNSYFSKMVGIITGNMGTIDKFIGDAILALFGAPKQTKNNSYYAVLSALKMINKLAEHNEEIISQGFPEMNIGIGIHFGDAIVGNIGSVEKMDYTVIGDSVNLASRLEGLTKYYGVQIIISEDVVNNIEDYHDKIRILEIDTVRVKGKKKATVIATIFDNDYITENIIANIEKFEKAYSLYRLGNFPEALHIFETLDDDFGLRKTYLERCASFIDNPPEKWEGIYDMETK